MTIAVRPPRRRWLAAALCCGLALLGNVASAAEDAQATQSGTPPADNKAPKCVHGCLNWGKQCNVDPRGVYKCVRRCEKFGEICE